MQINLFNPAIFAQEPIAYLQREIQNRIIRITVIALMVFEFISKNSEIAQLINRHPDFFNKIRTVSIQIYHCLILSITEMVHDFNFCHA